MQLLEVHSGRILVYQSTKTYGHELGFSACFRQHRADSHCRFLHGYALAFVFVFEADELDHRNWVVDFGGLKHLKQQLQLFFDHKLLVAEDDPHLELFASLQDLGAAELMIVPAVGCEAFAKMAWIMAGNTLRREGWDTRVRVVSCEVREHGANSAIYKG